MIQQRGQWASRLGFLLAAAGSAIGLGNIWKFPYVAGMNGGGVFVLLYLACVFFIGVPIMVGEFAIGRSTQRSPVEAFRALAGRSSAWQLVGWSGVLAGFLLLSFYSVVAGWTMHYIVLSLESFGGASDAASVAILFDKLYASPSLNFFWHQIFMMMTVGIVLGGVKGGIEKSSMIMMPALFLILAVLLVKALFMPGFREAFAFVFYPDLSDFKAASALEALGQAFFSLSIGMGTMLTYGSYLSRENDIVKSSVIVGVMDTGVALMASLIMFPILFSFGMDPQAGPGLVFKSMPIVFAQMPGGMAFSTIFFVLLLFAALTSAISLLEVVASFFVDTWGWDRQRAALFPGLGVFLFGVPSALAGWDGGALFGGRNVFDAMDFIVSNVLLPLGGLFMALYVGWRMDPKIVKSEFQGHSAFKAVFVPWLWCVRVIAPVAVAVVFLSRLGLIKF